MNRDIPMSGRQEERELDMAIDKDMKILLVEDSATTRKMEVKILTDLGFKGICEAVDGVDAENRLKAEKDIGLIISDWNMPQKSGFDLLIWARADEQYRHIPFIMATAQGEKRNTIAAMEAGAANTITKPFSAAELIKVLEETFSETKEEPAAPEKISRQTKSGKPLIRVAHIQITDHLTLGVLKHHININKINPNHFELETVCMSSWNPVQQALEKGDVDAAFILSPIAMDLFNYHVPIKLILFAHKNGSIAVRQKSKAGQASLKEVFQGKTFYIPHILSTHHMLIHMFLREIGLKPGLVGHEGVDVFFEVVPPVKMPEFLAANPDTSGFTVAEPMGTKAIAAGTGELLYLSGEMWEYHPCCVVVFRDEFIAAHPEAVQEFTNLLVQSGQFIHKNPEKSAEIAVQFLDPDKTLGLNVPVLKNVLKEAKGIKTDDLFPVAGDLDRIQKYMHQKMGIGTPVDLDKFIDIRFAQVACKGLAMGKHASVIHDASQMVTRIIERLDKEGTTKAGLDKAGRYLLFTLNDEDYGIPIHSVKEIIGMMSIRSIPQAPGFIKGVINLRNKVIPVIDLRAKFSIPEIDYHDRTCIVILEMGGMEGSFLVGIVVDAVSEVVNIQNQNIDDTPFFGKGNDTNYILAMAKINEQVKILLNTAHLFKQEETRALSAIPAVS
jgi:chemotaxis signal transduction protein/ABC-type nitrate/sulfonate/bicarbonate transport system substrate-binding protein/FixJ family two-component response regulator